MAYPILPSLPFNLKSGFKKTPNFNVVKQTNAAGMGNSSISLKPYPTWDFEVDLTYIQGSETLSASVLASFLGIYIQCNAGGSLFLMTDPNDYEVTAMQFGTGDGSTTAFQLSRTIDGIGVDVIQNPNGTINVYNNGSLKTLGTDYSISATGVISFASAPANTHALTWTGSFYYLCRFSEDTLADLARVAFNKSGAQFWSVSGIKFSSEFVSGSAGSVQSGVIPATPGVNVTGTPTAGQVLTATSAIAADWQNVSSGTFAYTGVLSGIPATATVGQLAFITDATPGRNIYECTSTNTWTQSGGGVSSVFTRTGAVTAQTGDYTQSQISSGAIASGSTATTQAAGDSSTKVATNAFVQNAVAEAGGIPVVINGLMAQYEMLVGETVASLPDHSGNGNTATGTVGTAPTIVPVTGGLTWSAWGGISLPSTLNSAVTIMAFVSWQSNPGSDVPNPIVGGSDASHYQSFGILDSTLSTEACATFYGQNSTSNFTANTRGTWNGSGVLSIVFETAPTTDQLWIGAVNNLDTLGNNSGGAGLQTDGNYIIGNLVSSSSYWWRNGVIYYLLFYNRALNAAEIAQNVTFMELQMAARGVATTTPANSSTNTVSQSVYEGDSITAGFGAMVPWPPQLVLNRSSDQFSNALAGIQLSTINKYAGLTDDFLYNNEAAYNFITVWAGTNDLYQYSQSVATVFNTITHYCNQRRDLGWKIMFGTVVSRATGDLSDTTGKDPFNLLCRQNWRQFADGLVDTGATPLGAGGANSNGVLFQADGIHPTYYSVSNIITPLWQMAINRYYGNRDFSSATVYASSATAAIATTAGSFATNSTGNLVTITVAALSANMVTGRMVAVAGVTPSGYNGTYRIFSTSGTTQLTYIIPNTVTVLGNISGQGTVVCPQQQDADYCSILNFGTGDFTLMPATGYTGQQIKIKNINASSSTIVPYGGTGASPTAETIDGASSLTIAAGATVTLESVLVSASAAGCNWITVN